MTSQELKSYIENEYNTIKSDPTYANFIKNNHLKAFDEDKIFHMRKPLPGWNEWRILSYNALRTSIDVGCGVSKELSTFLDVEFEAIKSDDPFNTFLNNSRLKAFDADKLFHIISTLPDFNEWRVLSYNSIRSHFLRYRHQMPCYPHPGWGGPTPNYPYPGWSWGGPTPNYPLPGWGGATPTPNYPPPSWGGATPTPNYPPPSWGGTTPTPNYPPPSWGGATPTPNYPPPSCGSATPTPNYPPPSWGGATPTPNYPPPGWGGAATTPPPPQQPPCLPQN